MIDRLRFSTSATLAGYRDEVVNGCGFKHQRSKRYDRGYSRGRALARADLREREANFPISAVSP